MTERGKARGTGLKLKKNEAVHDKSGGFMGVCEGEGKQ